MITLLAFQFSDGTDVVTAWYAANGPGVRAELDARMKFLRQQNREGWTRPRYDSLRDGIGEVRFKEQRIQYRALGYFGPERNQFCFLMFATKTNSFDPRNAIETAIERKALIERGDVSTVLVKRWGQQ